MTSSLQSPLRGPALFPGFPLTPEQPISYDPVRKGWNVFGYAEVQEVLSHPDIFSSNRGGLTPSSTTDTQTPFYSSLIYRDPPMHRQMRAPLMVHFSARQIALLEPQITALVSSLLDQVASRGEMDLIDDLAAPLPLLVIAHLLGLPQNNWEQFKHWTEAMFDAPATERQQAMHEMYDYFSLALDERRNAPGPDLLSALLTVEVEGHSLTAQELIGNCILFLIAGNETTRNLIGNTLLCLDAHPETMEALRAHPSLIPGALEEVLRFLPPVLTSPRVATVDTRLSGQPIKAGQWVMPWIGSANRDEAIFARPELFDIMRTPNRHLSLGYGPHFCLGATLARLEANIVLEALLTRFTSLRRVHSVPLQWIESFHICGVKHLSLTFESRRP